MSKVIFVTLKILIFYKNIHFTDIFLKYKKKCTLFFCVIYFFMSFFLCYLFRYYGRSVLVFFSISQNVWKVTTTFRNLIDTLKKNRVFQYSVCRTLTNWVWFIIIILFVKPCLINFLEGVYIIRFLTFGVVTWWIMLEKN